MRPSVGPSGVIELKSGKTGISAPANPSAIGIGCVSGLVLFSVVPLENLYLFKLVVHGIKPFGCTKDAFLYCWHCADIGPHSSKKVPSSHFFFSSSSPQFPKSQYLNFVLHVVDPLTWNSRGIKTGQKGQYNIFKIGLVWDGQNFDLILRFSITHTVIPSKPLSCQIWCKETECLNLLCNMLRSYVSGLLKWELK